MKRKENSDARTQLSLLEKDEVKPEMTPEENGAESNSTQNNGTEDNGTVFLLDGGELKPFSPREYTTSTLYRVVDSYGVECRLVRPDEPAGMVFEGKKPSKKTVPILVTKSGECVLLDSWEELESQPVRLSEARDVFGAVPAKQVFVLKRR